jgi:hypothetical protein
MTQIHQIATLFPLAVGTGAVLFTIFIHALALGATVNFVRYERRLGRAGAGAWIDLTIVTLVISFAFMAHLIGIALWAVLFVICGELPLSSQLHDPGGYGDLLLTPSWRLLGPLEAANGALMFGVSTRWSLSFNG